MLKIGISKSLFPSEYLEFFCLNSSLMVLRYLELFDFVVKVVVCEPESFHMFLRGS